MVNMRPCCSLTTRYASRRRSSWPLTVCVYATAAPNQQRRQTALRGGVWPAITWPLWLDLRGCAWPLTTWPLWLDRGGDIRWRLLYPWTINACAGEQVLTICVLSERRFLPQSLFLVALSYWNRRRDNRPLCLLVLLERFNGDCSILNTIKLLILSSHQIAIHASSAQLVICLLARFIQIYHVL